MTNPIYGFKKIDPFKILGESEANPILDGGRNPVPLLYNNEGQYNPAPRINQPSPVAETKTNPIKRFFSNLKTPQGYVRPEGAGLSANNPFSQYYTSKWWKPTVATQLKAQEWESQNQARQANLAAKNADNFTIDQGFIDKLSNNDPVKPYLRPGMQMSTDQLYRFAGLNQKQNALDSDQITDEERQQIADRYNQEINIYNPDGSINPEKYNYRQAVMSAIYDYTSKKGLQNALMKFNALQVPKALNQVKANNIVANTQLTNAKTVTEGERPALLNAQTANATANAFYTKNIKPEIAEATIANKNAGTQKKLSGGGNSRVSNAIDKTDKDFMTRIDKDYSQYMAQMKAGGKGTLSKTKDEWLKTEYPEKYNKYYSLQHGGPAPAAQKQNGTTSDKLVRKYKGTGAALKQIWGTNVPKNVVLELLNRYNRVNKTNYTITQYYEKFIK